MAELTPDSRLKVKRDTYFIPDPKGGVYFRNNSSSFRMEGKTIYQWIENLLPMFNGEQSMDDLTAGLTAPYRNRVYEIGETLYKNGFVRDVSKDTHHRLNRNVQEKFASQIEFIENFADSGAYRFQKYRQAKVLAVGSGPFLVSLISSFLQSGLPRITMMLTDTVPTNRERINELVQNARNIDSEVDLTEVPLQKEKAAWKEVIMPFDWIFYVSGEGDVNAARELNQICKQENKFFIPAVLLGSIGLAGPLTDPDSEGCIESAWRRLHQSALEESGESRAYSSTSGAVLANAAVFEFFKKAAGIAGTHQSEQIYFLNLETMEGGWLSYIPHPSAVQQQMDAQLVQEFESRLERESERTEQQGELLDFFDRLTSKETGILHAWEERNLPQLPLSQCYVQAVDPVTEGPAGLLPEVICSGLTHEEARKTAGLKGLELYVSKLTESLRFEKTRTENEKTDLPQEFVGIGAGETLAEAVCRGLQAWLDHELEESKKDHQKAVFRVRMGAIEDKRCLFFINALTTLTGAPAIGLKEEISGFPVFWVRSNGRWYTGAGLNRTLALRNALQQALLDAQNQKKTGERQEQGSMIFLDKKETKLEIPSCGDMTHFDLLQSSIQNLNKNGKKLNVYDLSVEPFLKQGLAGVYGVQVQEGEST